MRYKKIPTPPRQASALLSPAGSSAPMLGMLYVVTVKVNNKETGEMATHKLLLVGCEADDIERKMKWVFDTGNCGVMVKDIQKVREKVHFLSTIISKDESPVGPVVMRDEGSADVLQFTPQVADRYDPKLYAIGITTTMLAKDADHALRKVSTALMNRATVGKSHTGAQLHEDSVIAIEEVALSSGYAKPRDVSNEANRASFVRG